VGVTLIYTAGLKRVPYLEMLLVASGFLLRALAGATASHVPVSAWFLVVVSAAAVMVVTAKRRAEIIGDHSNRRVLSSYTPARIDLLGRLMLVAVLAAYTGWAAGEPSTGWAFASAFALTLVLLRFDQAARRGLVDSPEIHVVRDRVGLGLIAVWFALFLLTIGGVR
jgi:decaprenyl-phosphate phosphoribosyltransferase